MKRAVYAGRRLYINCLVHCQKKKKKTENNTGSVLILLRLILWYTLGYYYRYNDPSGCAVGGIKLNTKLRR